MLLHAPTHRCLLRGQTTGPRKRVEQGVMTRVNIAWIVAGFIAKTKQISAWVEHLSILPDKPVINCSNLATSDFIRKFKYNFIHDTWEIVIKISDFRNHFQNIWNPFLRCQNWKSEYEATPVDVSKQNFQGWVNDFYFENI